MNDCRDESKKRLKNSGNESLAIVSRKRQDRKAGNVKKLSLNEKIV